MSDIGIGTLGTAGPDPGFSSASLQNLDKDTFLQLLVAQMRYQNPLSPLDSNEYLAQAAQYASVEQLENMAQAQAELRSMQLVTIATGLMGQRVSAVDPFTGELVEGEVEAVRFGVEPILVIDGTEVPLSNVVTVGEEPTLDEPASPEGGDEPSQSELAPPEGATPAPPTEPEAGTDPPEPEPEPDSRATLEAPDTTRGR